MEPQPAGPRAVHEVTGVVATFPVAIIGVGNMGGAMATHLLAQGWPMGVCDLDSAKARSFEEFGAVAHVTPAQAAIDSIATIVCVVDAQQTHEVLFGEHGVRQAMLAGQVVMLCPTIAPEDTEEFARRLGERGIHTIDAPMSGGPARARDGSMSLMVACPDAVFERYGALIAALSTKVFRISERVGDGARTKLVNNLLAGINLVGAAEVMVMAKRMGLDLNRTLDVIEQSSGQSWIGSDRMRRAIAADYAPRAHMTLLEKDTRLAVAAAAAAGFAGPLGAAARDVFGRASAAGLAELDDAALLQWLDGDKA
ncbi:MAG: NAD(P)-dependent oxidoreductase [Rhodoferax sp.]|nr:NAD(P)-dependent oxidoreductase [Rhodoferax sp.]